MGAKLFVQASYDSAEIKLNHSEAQIEQGKIIIQELGNLELIHTRIWDWKKLPYVYEHMSLEVFCFWKKMT